MSENLVVSVEEGVATLTLNRPETMNALNHALFQALEAAISDIGKREDIAYFCNPSVTICSFRR